MPGSSRIGTSSIRGLVARATLATGRLAQRTTAGHVRQLLPVAAIPGNPPRWAGPAAWRRYNDCCVTEEQCPRENVMPFQKFGLPDTLLNNVRALGYVTPTPIQDQAIPAIGTGRDLVATAQTGTGKTAAFLLPVLRRLLERPRGRAGALVLTPTRELAQQIDGCFRGLAAGTGLRSALVIGGAPEFPQVRALRAGAELVVATPGRLLALLRDKRCALPGLGVLILDEADQMF